MQLLSRASMPGVRPDPLARQIIETVPLVMQFMRRQMRRASSRNLSVAQLRTLYFINVHDRPSLSDASDFIGLSLPAMSRLVDGLVRKELVSRTSCPNDRRHIRLEITSDGKSALDEAWKHTHVKLVEVVREMSVEQRETLASAMELLKATFDPEVVKE